MDKKLVFRYLFEIVIIVFSVTLSFYIQEVLNDIEKEELKNETLRGMLDDLEKTKSDFYWTRIYLNERLKRCEKITITKKITSEDLIWVINGWEWETKAPSYESLMATGAAEYIKNKELYKKIVEFYDQRLIKSSGKDYTMAVIELKKYLMVNYAIKSMITTEQFFNQNDWPTGIYYDYDDKSLRAMSQDEVVINHIYQFKNYMSTMLFWLNFINEKLPTLTESIEKEISS